MTVPSAVDARPAATVIVLREGEPFEFLLLRRNDKVAFIAGFGVTVVKGHGIELDVLVLFVVAPRRRGDEVLRIIRDTDPSAFVTTDAVN